MKTEKLLLLIEPSLKEAVHDWRRSQPDAPSLGEAVRRLLRQALDAEAGSQTIPGMLRAAKNRSND
ncbi:MAG: hypothetical protein AAF763_15695 [Pseudomonadota bacterium]